MTQRLLTVVLAALLQTNSGCLFGRKSKPKENDAIAGEVEESFQRRWIDKRAGELVAGGATAEVARDQAAKEFREKYEYTGAGK